MMICVYMLHVSFLYVLVRQNYRNFSVDMLNLWNEFG